MEPAYIRVTFSPQNDEYIIIMPSNNCEPRSFDGTDRSCCGGCSDGLRFGGRSHTRAYLLVVQRRADLHTALGNGHDTTVSGLAGKKRLTEITRRETGDTDSRTRRG